MTLIIREAEVRQLLTMPDAIDALDTAFAELGRGNAQNSSRQRIVLPQPPAVLHMLAGAVPGLDALGFKAYSGAAGTVRFSVNLYRASTGELLSIMEADWLGRMRTGAASGLATRYLAREDAVSLGVLGSGGQAETQIMAIAAVRPLQRIRVFSRNQERLQQFCTDLGSRLGLTLEPVASAEAAVRGADILVTATVAREPVVLGEWLRLGVHINAMGSNWANRREIDTATVTAATHIFADSIEQAKLEAGDLVIPVNEGKLAWSRVQELSALIAGTVTGRTAPEDITLFNSLGIGLEDVAVAMRIYTLARERGIGQEVALFA